MVSQGYTFFLKGKRKKGIYMSLILANSSGKALQELKSDRIVFCSAGVFMELPGSHSREQVWGT